MFEKIRELASLFLSIEEICIVLDMPIDLFYIPNSQEYKAYQKGLLESEIELRKEILQSAKQGSPAAQDLAVSILKNTKTKNAKNG